MGGNAVGCAGVLGFTFFGFGLVARIILVSFMATRDSEHAISELGAAPGGASCDVRPQDDWGLLRAVWGILRCVNVGKPASRCGFPGASCDDTNRRIFKYPSK